MFAGGKINEFDDGIGAQLLQYRVVCGVCRIENLSSTGTYGISSVLRRVNECGPNFGIRSSGDRLTACQDHSVRRLRRYEVAESCEPRQPIGWSRAAADLPRRADEAALTAIRAGGNQVAVRFIPNCIARRVA